MVLDEISSQHLALRDYFGFKEAFSTLKLSQFAVPGKQMLRQSQSADVALEISTCAREWGSQLNWWQGKPSDCDETSFSPVENSGGKDCQLWEYCIGWRWQGFFHHLVPSVAGGFSRRMCLSYHLLTQSSTGSNDLHTLRKVRPPAWKPRWISMKQTGGGCKWTTLFRSGQKVLP